MNFIEKLFNNGCCFCGFAGDLSTVRQHHAYSETTHHYHESCVRDVLAKPEFYGNKKVDIALDIENCITYNNRRNAERQDAAKRALERLGDT